MKSKEELKKLFENGDKPTQENFWEWQDSYWHKEEKLPAENIGSYKIRGSVPNLTTLHLMSSMSEGDVYNLLDTGDNYVYVLDLNNTGEAGWDKLGGTIDLSSETLSAVMNRGNVASVELKFHDNAKLWYDLPTFSYHFNSGKSPSATGKYNTAIGWGVLSAQTSGYENVGIGSNSIQKLTTGFYNSAIGCYALSSLTTGGANTTIGYASFYPLIDGNVNVGLGTHTGFSQTNGGNNFYGGGYAGHKIRRGSKNTLLGSFSGYSLGGLSNSAEWNLNTFIGYNAASTSHAMGLSGSNNVVIGANAPFGGIDIKNKLVIDSYTDTQRHDLVFPLIGGDFSARTLDFDASLKVRRLVNAEGNNEFTKNIVAKSDGTFGWEDKTNSNGIPLNGTQVGEPVSGKVEFSTSASIESGTAIMKMDDGYISFKSGLSTGVTISPDQVFIRQGTEKYINMSNELDKIIIGSTGSGVDGANYYGGSYGDNSFVQKKYVDQKLSYSNQEQVTGGEWIDGKPIYRKTIKFEDIPANGEIDLTTDFRDIENIVSNQMFTEWYAMDVAFAGNQYRGKAFITLLPEMVQIEYISGSDYDYSLINSFTLTLEYTKKTD